MAFVIAATGQTWSQVGWEWDLPRYLAWQEARGHLPLLDRMVGSYLGYKPPPRSQPDTANMTQEEHAERLLGQLGVM